MREIHIVRKSDLVVPWKKPDHQSNITAGYSPLRHSTGATGAGQQPHTPGRWSKYRFTLHQGRIVFLDSPHLPLLLKLFTLVKRILWVGFFVHASRAGIYFLVCRRIFAQPLTYFEPRRPFYLYFVILNLFHVCHWITMMYRICFSKSIELAILDD